MYRNTDGIEFLRSLPDKSVDGIFTDPPWGKGPDIVGQDIWKELLQELDKEGGRVLRPGGRVLVWVGMRMFADTVKQFTNLDYRWAVFCNYIPPRYIAGFESILDPIILFMRPGDKYPMRKEGKLRQIYEKVSNGQKDTSHPCARPFITVKQILRDWFDEQEYVIDPFAGSDTTGVACRLLNLKYDTCEIDPKMFMFGKDRNDQYLPLTFSPREEGR